MTKYFFRKLLFALPTLLVVTFLASAMLSLIPGDPSKVALGVNWNPEVGKEYLKELGLDRALPVRYAKWISKAVRFDFGTSYYDKGPVGDRISRGFSLTMQLVVWAMLLALIIAIPLGIYAAYREGTRRDRVISTLSFGALSIPGFVAAVLLVVIIRNNTGNFFQVDYKSFFDSPATNFRSLFLPALSTAIGLSAGFIRILRTDMSTTLKEDFVLMAKAKGLSDKYILMRHAFRPSAFTLMTVIGVSIGQLLGTLVIVEQFFALNGLGSEIFRSILQRDYATTLGAVTVVTVVFIVISTLVDVLYGAVDPRVRMARSLA
jgi:peptide/nickel transport system permease protein